MTLETAVSELAPRVLRYCVGYVGDRTLGEEVAQESLAALVKAWRTSGPPDHPDAFVFAVAKRRARRALWHRSLLRPLEMLRDRRQEGTDPEQEAIENDQRTRVLRAIRRLPRAERDAVLLVIGDGRTLNEAAQAARVSLSAMKMRLSRARQRLQRMVNERHER